MLLAGHECHLPHDRAHPQPAEQLLTVRESRITGANDPIELAAYAAVAGVVLNLDETATKE